MDQFYREHFKKFLETNAKENKLLQNSKTEQKSEPKIEKEKDVELKSPIEIVYKNEDLSLLVQQNYFQRQKKLQVL